MPVAMTACSESEVWVHALNKRQQVQQEHEALTRTAWQNAAELYHLQARNCSHLLTTLAFNFHCPGRP